MHRQHRIFYWISGPLLKLGSRSLEGRPGADEISRVAHGKAQKVVRRASEIVQPLGPIILFREKLSDRNCQVGEIHGGKRIFARGRADLAQDMLKESPALKSPVIANDQ